MTADELFNALTRSGKPIPTARMRKAEAKADSPAVWAAVLARLQPYLTYTPPDPPDPPAQEPEA